MTRKRRMPAAGCLLPPLPPLGILAEDFSKLVRGRPRTRPMRPHARRAAPQFLH